MITPWDGQHMVRLSECGSDTLAHLEKALTKVRPNTKLFDGGSVFGLSFRIISSRVGYIRPELCAEG
jgi:hypothetical protein